MWIEAHGFRSHNIDLHGVTCRKSIEATGTLGSLTSQLTAQGHGMLDFVRRIGFLYILLIIVGLKLKI